MWSEQGSASTQQWIDTIFSSSILWTSMLQKRSYALHVYKKQTQKTDPDHPYVMEKLYNAMYWNVAIDPAVHWWGMEARAVFGGSNKPTQGGLTLQIVTHSAFMVILQGAEINVFRFPLQMLIRMPSTRVCRSWWWRGRRRWQPDQWRLRWRCGEGVSESWWWALNEPSNSSSRRLCIGWKEKVVLLVLVSTPYLQKRIFFFQSSIVCHFLFGESLVMITNVVSQFHRVL